jgi:hypothetical protein
MTSRLGVSLALAVVACSPARSAEDARPDATDLVQVTLPGWSAAPGRTPFERFVDYREPAGACVVRVTHWLPARPGDPPVEPAPVTVLGRRDVVIDGRRLVLLRTSDAGNPQSVSIERAGRTAMLAFTGCDDAAIDRVLGQTHLAR